MSEFVLDASALLAVLQDEPGSSRVQSTLSRAAISTVNLSEVATRLIDGGVSGHETRQILRDLGLEIHDFTEQHAFAASALRSLTKGLGLSLGDRACLALGISLSLPILTADRVWKDLPAYFGVELIR